MKLHGFGEIAGMRGLLDSLTPTSSLWERIARRTSGFLAFTLPTLAVVIFLRIIATRFVSLSLTAVCENAQREGGEDVDVAPAAEETGAPLETAKDVRASEGLGALLEVDGQDKARRECHIVTARNVLLILSEVKGNGLAGLLSDFCGIAVRLEDSASLPQLAGKVVYLCGDITHACSLGELEAASHVCVIRELSHGCDVDSAWPIVDLGRVPVLVHGVGVYYRRFFDLSLDCFRWIQDEHAFQTLTESNKSGTAHRTGIYLTPVQQIDQDVHFRLLRCSTNFSGPTVNFGQSDTHIVGALNEEAAMIFQDRAPLNHVLAQVYHNTPASGGQKQSKAKIKEHSDKTKDMPDDGLMAFCTFYDRLDRLQPLDVDGFDYGHQGISGLTKLRFRLKPCVAERPGCTLARQFSVTLFPNSVFFMPLSTNRLYTHEIRPSALDAHMLPTRMGYVVRCSEAEAVHRGGQTFLKAPGGGLALLGPPTSEGMNKLRALYAEENSSDAFMDYSKHGELLFSMNNGDYMRPILDHQAEDFRLLSVRDVRGDPFKDLLASARFENVGKGRLGTVLLKPDAARGIPIVRTTTRYAAPAQCFQPVHMRLAQQIQRLALLPVSFNNALIERYTNAYATMGFHSDQDLDLEEGTFIALYSCYKHPELERAPRKLVVESKEPGGRRFDVPLTHNSVVVWSTETNRRYRHKIVLDSGAHPPENEWLGVTFRTSKTFVHFQGASARFEDGVPLVPANEDQRREFYKMRRRENEGIEFAYPRLTYTISESDLMLPRLPLTALLVGAGHV